MHDSSPQRPRHVAVIMDGNGRWAERRGRPRPEGHAEGAVAARDTIRAACESGVAYLTLYAFSAANWQRPEPEVRALMTLLADFAVAEGPELRERRVRVGVIGCLEDLPESTRCAVEDLVQSSASAAGPSPAMTLTLALSYGSRRDIARAAASLAEDFRAGRATELDEAALRRRLSTRDLPDVDLLIRTGGEQRLSDFMVVEAAFAELCFPDVLWPDFRAADLRQALDAYAHRERRFGRTSAQLRADR